MDGLRIFVPKSTGKNKLPKYFGGGVLLGL